MTGGFQQQVNNQPAQALPGDFASNNPWSSYDAGPGGLVAGSAGVNIGVFAWVNSPLDPNSTPTSVSNSGLGAPAGLVPRRQQGLNTVFLSNAGTLIQAGFPMNLVTGGDFWVKNDGTAQCTPGMKAYADLNTGKVSFAAAGAPTQAASVTADIAASTFSVTGSIAGNLLTVTAVGSGTIVRGATISGSGIASGTRILSQASGTAGGIGTYYVSIGEQTVASTTVSGTYGTMTVAAVGSGAIVNNGLLAGSGVAAGTQVTQFLTGTGGTGTYAVNNNTVVGSTTITETTNVETNWKATSGGLATEIVKISLSPMGS